MEENSNEKEEKVSSTTKEFTVESLDRTEVGAETGEVTTEKIEGTEVNSVGGLFVEVPAKKIVLGSKVLTVSSRRHINEIAGEVLSKEEIKERLIVAIKENGEREIEDPPIGPPIDDPIDKPIDDPIDKQPEEKKISKFNPKYLLPVALLALLALLINSCNAFTNKGPEIEYDIIPLDAIVYNVDNPGTLTYNIRQVLGQEGMTANGVEGDSSFNGKYYYWEEQAGIEKETSAESIQIEDVKDQIEVNMQIFVDKNSTQEQRYQALKKLLELHKIIKQKFIENQSEVEQYSQETIDALEAYPDENTAAEKKVVKYNLEEYMQEFGLASFNVEELSQIVQLMEAGYEITVEVEKELDGDYQITGKAVKTIVKDREPGKLRSAWDKMVKFVRGEPDKGIEK